MIMPVSGRCVLAYMCAGVDAGVDRLSPISCHYSSLALSSRNMSEPQGNPGSLPVAVLESGRVPGQGNITAQLVPAGDLWRQS